MIGQEEAAAVAAWWADRLEGATSAQVDAFRLALTRRVEAIEPEDLPSGPAEADLSTDYHPDEILQAAASDAGIEITCATPSAKPGLPALPAKAHTIIKLGTEVLASGGRGAPRERIWRDRATAQTDDCECGGAGVAREGNVVVPCPECGHELT